MEEVDGLFSSPEKSPAKLNRFGTAADDDSVSSEMSMDEGALTTPSLPTRLMLILPDRDRQWAWSHGLYRCEWLSQLVLPTASRALPYEEWPDRVTTEDSWVQIFPRSTE